jgi:hypothetical protein
MHAHEYPRCTRGRAAVDGVPDADPESRAKLWSALARAAPSKQQQLFCRQRVGGAWLA